MNLQQLRYVHEVAKRGPEKRMTLLSIGLTTRFRDLQAVGWKPFWAFSIGVAVNVVLGFILSVIVFGSYWASI